MIGDVAVEAAPDTSAMTPGDFPAALPEHCFPVLVDILGDVMEGVIAVRPFSDIIAVNINFGLAHCAVKEKLGICLQQRLGHRNSDGTIRLHMRKSTGASGLETWTPF